MIGSRFSPKLNNFGLVTHPTCAPSFVWIHPYLRDIMLCYRLSTITQWWRIRFKKKMLRSGSSLKWKNWSLSPTQPVFQISYKFGHKFLRYAAHRHRQRETNKQRNDRQGWKHNLRPLSVMGVNIMRKRLLITTDVWSRLYQKYATSLKENWEQFNCRGSQCWKIQNVRDPSISKRRRGVILSLTMYFGDPGWSCDGWQVTGVISSRRSL